MLKFKNLSVLFCLLSTSASAAIVVPGMDLLLPTDREKVFSILIQRKHDIENEAHINADLKAALPAQNFNAYWVPDTLYQVIQSYYDLDGPQGKIKQGQRAPEIWKEGKKRGAIFHQYPEFKSFYPLTLTEQKTLLPSLVMDWARFNNEAHYRLQLAEFKTKGAAHALSQMLHFGPRFQGEDQKNGFDNRNIPDADIYKRTAYLPKNKALLEHALKVEEQAHQEGKLLLWRYTQPIIGEIPDLPFKIRDNDLGKTLANPLEYHSSLHSTEVFEKGNRISYGSRLLDGFIGDGPIPEQPYQYGAAAGGCVFSFVANDEAVKKKGQLIPDFILYSLSLSPNKIKDLNNNLTLYYPREIMPQHLGLYGEAEGFHPSWLVDFQEKKSTEAWLELMGSEAIQVHHIKGKLQANPQQNPGVWKFRNIYGRFLNKVKAEAIALPQPAPVVAAKPAPVVAANPSISQALANNPNAQGITTAKQPAPSVVLAKTAPTTRTTAVAPVRQPVVVAKKAAPPKKAVPVKKAAPLKKAAPVKKAAPPKKAVPVKKAAPPKKAAPIKKAVPIKAVPVKKATPPKKAVPVKKAAPVKKAPVKRAPPKKAPAPVKKRR